VADDPCTLVSTRVFAVPRATLFDAFRDPAKLARWWGPEGFTNVFETFDFRPGGLWTFVMHGPDGTGYPNESVFEEIVGGERIVFVHQKPLHPFVMTMTYADRDGGTELKWAMRHPTPAECDAVRAFVPAANEQNFDRLERLIRETP
jgi:uncharacterized protein YndB with AHSA1/START domain